MSVGVAYINSRYTIKVTPTMSLEKVLEEACVHYKIDRAEKEARLRLGKKYLDLNLPWRFANIPSNTTVELEVISKNAGGAKLAACRIALRVGDKSLMGTFPASTSLEGVLAHFIKEGSIIDVLTKPDAFEPEVIYFQSRFAADALKGTSLSSLGLSGSSARLQLQYKEAKGMKEDDNCGGDMMEASDSATANVEKLSAAADEQAPDVGQPMVALREVLNSNFDAVSKPAVLTLCKYLFNAFAYPEEAKYRTIYADNRLFLERVAGAKGADNFLLSAGFCSSTITGRPAFVLPPSSSSFSSSGSEEKRLEAACKALELALVELNVPADEQPVLKTPDQILRAKRAQEQATKAAAAASGLPAFDPFKTFSRRVEDVGDNGAISSGATLAEKASGGNGSARKSATEERLEQLEQRRRELEGSKEDVKRDSRLVMPSSCSQGRKVEDTMDVADDDGDLGKVDRQILASSLRGKFSRAEDAPLTTSASRALQSAQTETVYNRTVIKVRFPNKVELAGTFHPRHTVADVYEWVLGCLHDNLRRLWSCRPSISPPTSSSGPSRNKKRTGDAISYPFELYTAPPRQVVEMYKRPAGIFNVWEGEKAEADPDTLFARQYVPAAVMMVSWTDPATEAWVDRALSNSDSSLIPYFAESLLLVAGGKDDGTSGSVPFPDGVALVPEAHKAGSSSGGSSASSSSGGKERAAVKERKSGKPSWFKL